MSNITKETSAGIATIAYHGCALGARGMAIGAERNANKFKWLAENRRVAEYYANGGVRTPPGVLYPGATVSEVLVVMQSPLIVDLDDPAWITPESRKWSTTDPISRKTITDIGFVKDKAARMAISNGNDGIVFRNGYDGGRIAGGDIYAIPHTSVTAMAVAVAVIAGLAE
jgi:hypothetical protein